MTRRSITVCKWKKTSPLSKGGRRCLCLSVYLHTYSATCLALFASNVKNNNQDQKLDFHVVSHGSSLWRRFWTTRDDLSKKADVKKSRSWKWDLWSFKYGRVLHFLGWCLENNLQRLRYICMQSLIFLNFFPVWQWRLLFNLKTNPLLCPRVYSC